jgi:hypothetical protein
MRSLVAIGIVLVTVSVYPLLLMSREAIVGHRVSQRYAVEATQVHGPVGIAHSLTAELGGHRVELTDDQLPFAREPFTIEEGRSTGLVRVMVDGRSVSSPVTAVIRRAYNDANRYWGYVYLKRLKDLRGPERLVVAQNLGVAGYRTISVFADGTIIEDAFEYSARCSPPVRALLIQPVVPHPNGYCSDVLQVWPSIWYPILYPFFSGALGGILLLIGVIRSRKPAAAVRARLGLL